MASVVSLCSRGGPLRQAAQQYNVPLATLHRRVNRSVEMGCNPGPNPVLSCTVEKRLVEYVIEMSDMGFGFAHVDIMRLAYQIAVKGGIDHPFQNRLAGHK